MRRNSYQPFPSSDPDQEEDSSILPEDLKKPSHHPEEEEEEDIVKPPSVHRPGVAYVSAASSKNDKVAQKLQASVTNLHFSSSLTSTSFIPRVQHVSTLDERIARKQQQANKKNTNQKDAKEDVKGRNQSDGQTSFSASSAVSVSSNTEYEKRLQRKQQQMASSSSSNVDYEKRLSDKQKKMAPSYSSTQESKKQPKPGTFDRISDLDERIARKSRGLPATPPTSAPSPAKSVSKPGVQYSYTKKEEDRTNIKSSWVKDDLFDPNHTPDHPPQHTPIVRNNSDDEGDDDDEDDVDPDMINAHENDLHQKLAGGKSKKGRKNKSNRQASLIPENTLNPDLHAAAMIGAIPTRNNASNGNDDYNERLRRKQGWVSDSIFDPNTRITHNNNNDDGNTEEDDANPHEESTTGSADEFHDEPNNMKDGKGKSVKFSIDDDDDDEGDDNDKENTTFISQNQADTSNLKYASEQQEQEETQPGAFNISRRAFRRIPGMFQRQSTRNSTSSSGFLSFRSSRSKKGFGSASAIYADVELSKHELSSSHQEKSLFAKLCQGKTNIFIGIIILSIIMSAIIVPVILSRNDSNNDNSKEEDSSSIYIVTPPPVNDIAETPSLSPEKRSEMFDYFYDALLPLSSEDKLQSSSSPEGKALYFLAYRDSILRGTSDQQTLTQTDLIQRYALLVLFYQYGDIYSIIDVKNGILDVESVLASKHVCDWNHHIIKCKTVFVSAGGEVTSFDMGDEETTVSPVDHHHGLRKLKSVTETLERRIVTEFILKGQSPLMRGQTVRSEIGLLSNLEILNLNNNGLIGRLPDQLYKLKSLRELVLSDNEWKVSMDSRIGEFPRLKTLSLERSNLKGSIPKSLQNLSELEILLLHNNELYGEILDVLRPLDKLVTVDCYGNDFFGSIPTSIGTWSNLDYFNIGNSRKLDGSIPTEIGLLTRLKYFDIRNTGIDGHIPSELGKCGSLEAFVANDCFLDGYLPTSLGNLSNLKHLLLHRNRLQGKIPNDMGNLESLEKLSLFNNYLSGEVPYTFGQLKNLTELRLQGNALSGHIHTNICSLRDRNQLQVLEADSTQCDGIDKSCCT